jgi:uncharacterized protein YqfB (UPF0267 family)
MAKEKGILSEALRLNDEAKGKKAKGYFNQTGQSISYPTGFPQLDYYLGYKTFVYGENNEVIDSYYNLGITGGTYTLVIGKSSTGKTAAVVKIAANIIRPFKTSTIVHFDNERAMTYTRIKALTRMPIRELENRYILRQEKLTLDDMKAIIYDIYKEKTENREKYLYDTGKKDEFGKEIILPEPTVVILDSIANITEGLASKDEENEEITSQTDRLRLTGSIGRFLSDIMNFLKEANILFFAINHIMVNPQLNVIKSPAEMLYLSNQENCAGGRKQFSLANQMLKFTNVGSEKYDESEEGFDGFLSRITILKSRSNSDGKTFDLIYDKDLGHSVVRSTVNYLNDKGLVSGNKNGYYFINDADKNKFTLANMDKDFKNNPILYKIMMDNATPLLECELGGLSDDDLAIPDEELNIYNL